MDAVVTWAVGAIFVATYLGMALGRVPGLALDRSGIAVIAAIAVVAIGALAPERIVEAIHFPTLILLPPSGPPPALPEVDRAQCAKASVATLLLLALFFTPIPRELSAIAVAGVLLMSRRFASRDMLTSVDWPLLLLFACLFIVNRALADTGLTREGIGWLAAQGLGFDALRVMLPAALVASNTIGNVPAVIMLLAAEPRWPAGVLQALALTTTLAGNFFLVGSIANLIVAERAARAGVAFGFAAHLRAGVPLTLASVALAAAWLLATGRVSW